MEKGDGELKNDPKSRKDAELGIHRDIAKGILVATDYLCLLVRSQDVDVFTFVHT